MSWFWLVPARDPNCDDDEPDWNAPALLLPPESDCRPEVFIPERVRGAGELLRVEKSRELDVCDEDGIDDALALSTPATATTATPRVVENARRQLRLRVETFRGTVFLPPGSGPIPPIRSRV